MVFRLLVGRTDVLGRKAMPRIAASLAVLLTAVTCIGFNTARYPAVWRMLTLSEGAGAADRSDDPTASTQSVAAAEPEALAPSAPSWPSDGQADDDGTDSTDRESTAGESSPAYVSGEDGSSDDDSDERVDQARNQGSHDGWNELPRESSFGSYAPPARCLVGVGSGRGDRLLRL
jgi:hypothetical protein